MQIRDLKNLVLKVLGKANEAWSLVEILGPNKAVEFAAIDKTDKDKKYYEDNFPEYYDELVEWATSKVEARDERKRLAHSEKYSSKTNNRALYLPYPVFTYYEHKAEQRRWKYDFSLRAQGLMTLAVNYEFGEQAVPCAFNMVNLLPMVEDPVTGDLVQEQIDDDTWKYVIDQGITVSGSRLGWNQNSPAWSWLYETFQTYEDFSAYNHSLNAPVLPGGYASNCKVTLKVLKDREGNDLLTDGSGTYHPQTPELQDFIQRYGLVPCQIRFINRQNVFCKGVLFPSEDSLHQDQSPGVVFDWLQVKGRYKPQAKQNRLDDVTSTIKGHLGVIQVWKNPGTLKGGFEVLENIQDNNQSREIITRTLENSFRLLKKKGIDGLVAKLAKDDDNIKLIIQLVTQMKALGANIEATQIPRIKEAVQDKLGRILWHQAQGAGIEFKRYVCRLDSTVPPGKIVASGFVPGTLVCGFRFPVVLSQGLVTLEVIAPSPHMLVNGEEIPHHVAMNPRDLTTKMQGDDDGDIIGLSADPEMVRLFSSLVDNNIYHIEPKGVKRLGQDGLPIKTNSQEGQHLIYRDQRGPVGRCTNMRSKALAVGAVMEAVGCSLSIQESVDRAKRLPEWSDYRVAADITKWRKEPDGYHFDHKLPAKELLDGELNTWNMSRHIQEVVNEQLSGREVKVLGWKHKGKKIKPEEWEPCALDAEVGNLVHWCHNEAHRLWKQMAEEFKISSEQVLSLEDLLPMCLDLKQVEYEILVYDFKTYQEDLYHRSGLADLCKGLAKNQGNKLAGEESDLYKNENQDLHKRFYQKASKLTVSEQVTCWYMEALYGNPNNCFRIVAFPGSKTLELLEVINQKSCQFMLELDPVKKVQRLELATDWVLKHQEVGDKLSDMVHKNTSHFDEVQDLNGEGIPLWQCTDCLTSLQTGVVSKIRELKKREEHSLLKELNTKLNRL